MIPSFGATEVLTTFQEAILALTYNRQREDRQSAQIHCHQLAGRLSLIADGKYRNTSVGRNTWNSKLLIRSQAAQLQ